MSKDIAHTYIYFMTTRPVEVSVRIKSIGRGYTVSQPITIPILPGCMDKYLINEQHNN